MEDSNNNLEISKITSGNYFGIFNIIKIDFSKE